MTAEKVLLLWESPHESTISKKQMGEQIPKKSTKNNQRLEKRTSEKKPKKLSFLSFKRPERIIKTDRSR